MQGVWPGLRLRLHISSTILSRHAALGLGLLLQGEGDDVGHSVLVHLIREMKLDKVLTAFYFISFKSISCNTELNYYLM